MGRLANLKEAVFGATGQHTIYLDEMPKAGQLLREPAKALPYIDCVGAVVAPLDLMPLRLTNAKNRGAKSRDTLAFSVTSFAGLCAVAAALCVFSYLRLNEAQAANTKILAQLNELGHARTVYDRYKMYTDSSRAIMSIRELVASPNDEIVTFLEEFERHMPRDILVLSATFSSDGITMSIEVPTKTDVARVITQLRGFSSLAELSIPALTEDTTRGVVSFSLSCTYATQGNSAENPHESYSLSDAAAWLHGGAPGNDEYFDADYHEYEGAD